MNYKIKNKNQSTIHLTAFLDRSDLDHYIDQAYKYLSNNLKIDGFRKGKAPLEVSRDSFDKNEILETALEFALRQSLSEILIKENIEPIEFSEFKIEENSEQKLIWSVFITVFPKIKLPNYQEIKIKRKNITVLESEVDSVLEFLKKSRRKFDDIERPSRFGDKMLVDFKIRDGDKEIKNDHRLSHYFILGETEFFPGLNEQLKNLKKGENKKFVLKMPNDFHIKDLANKKLSFQVEIKDIKEPKVPDLNDEFARSIGNFKSLFELRESITDGLRQEKEAKEKQRIRALILDYISKQTKVEVPKILVERQVDDLIRNFDLDLHKNGMELSLYLAKIDKTYEEFKRSLWQKAKEDVKRDLILIAIAKAENIQVTPQELETSINEFLKSIIDINNLNEIDLENLNERIKFILLEEKVFQFLESRITYIS